MTNFTSKLLSDPHFKLCTRTSKMPPLIMDKKEKLVSRLLCSNGLVEDPLAVEKERTMINPWTAEEKKIFMDNLVVFGKDFRKIASFIDHKTTADCVEFYYKNPSVVMPSVDGLPMNELQVIANSINDESDDEQLDQACRATALLGIGSVVYLDPRGGGVVKKWLIDLVRDVPKIKDFAWGAASWANLHSCLKALKEDTTNQRTYLFGCVLALEWSILLRFPKLVSLRFKELASILPAQQHAFPLMTQILQHIGTFKDTTGYKSHEEYLAAFAGLTEEDVVWTPYVGVPLNLPYEVQVALGRSIVIVVCVYYAVNHRPDVATQQYFPEDPDICEDWVSSLPLSPFEALTNRVNLFWNLTSKVGIRDMIDLSSQGVLRNIVAEDPDICEDWVSSLPLSITSKVGK